jgi:hypothetical protein
LSYIPSILQGAHPVGSTESSQPVTGTISNTQITPATPISKNVQFGQLSDNLTSFEYVGSPVSASSASISMTGGSHKKCIATGKKMLLQGRLRNVYEGPRGGKYVKKNGKYVSLSSFKK